jgi:hypothetical protein
MQSQSQKKPSPLQNLAYLLQFVQPLLQILHVPGNSFKHFVEPQQHVHMVVSKFMVQVQNLRL